MVGRASGTLNTITPCAACKLLRRRCAQECPFSPYFSPDEPHKFASVHKIFGASNVSKMLMEVPESQRADAANSLVYEANVRLRDPVYGCMGTISVLQQEIQYLQAQLNAVKDEMIKYKYMQANGIMVPSYHEDLFSSANVISIANPSAVAPPEQWLLPPSPPSPSFSLAYTPSSPIMFGQSPSYTTGECKIIPSLNESMTYF